MTIDYWLKIVYPLLLVKSKIDSSISQNDKLWWHWQTKWGISQVVATTEFELYHNASKVWTTDLKDLPDFTDLLEKSHAISLLIVWLRKNVIGNPTIREDLYLNSNSPKFTYFFICIFNKYRLVVIYHEFCFKNFITYLTYMDFSLFIRNKLPNKFGSYSKN